MSRIGKKPVKIESGVKVSFQNGIFLVEGPKGKLSCRIAEGIFLKLDKDTIEVTRDLEKDATASLYGLTRTLIQNMVHGVHTGFSKDLEIFGVGYGAKLEGSVLVLALGYSKDVRFELPFGISVKIGTKAENRTPLSITGADKILIGMTAAKIRSLRPPEPYKGKGVMYAKEKILRKPGKSAKAK